MEETTSEQHKKNILSMLEQCRKEAIHARIRFLIGLIMSMVFMWLGALGLGSTKIIIMDHDISGTPAQYALGGTFMLIGVLVTSLTVLASCIRKSKLAILVEFKQFELRITEMLKK